MLELDRRLNACFGGVLRPALEEQGIRLVTLDTATEEERREIDARFHEQVFPALTPLVIGLGRPFPYISNLSLSLGVLLRDPESGTEIIARVKVPKELLGRFLPLGDDGKTFVPLEEVIAANLDLLFPGTEVIDHGYFRVTRDADFTVSDEADDLLQAVQDEIRRRRFGEVVRLEIAAGMNSKLREQLIGALRLEDREVYDVDGLIDLADLTDIADVPGHAELRYSPWSPVTQPRLQGEDDEPVDMFAAIRQRRPARPPSLRLVRHLGRALRRAGGRRPRRAGDQADRLPHQRRLAAGAVADPRLRTRQAGGLHGRAEGALRRGGQHPLGEVAGGGRRPRRLRHPRPEDAREGDPGRPPRGRRVREYVHIGTGNYHPKTARLYTDFGLFTADPDIGADVAEMFNFLTGYGRPAAYRKVLVSPTTMREPDHRGDRAHRSPPTRPAKRRGSR